MATLNSLALKSKVKFGSIYGKPIVWLVAAKNHSGYPSGSVTLVTNQIIKLICFDAKEPSNTYRDRRDYGNNRYIYSNLRQWLNSNAGAGQWYTAQHSADQAPDSYHVWQSKCPYDTIAGFLNGFTANDRAALLSTTLTVGKSSTDGGGTETCTDKIFPLSCTEVALSGDHVCGSKLAIFSDDSSRIATVSASAADDANFGSFANQAHSYWLRDARAESADDASNVYTEGTLIAKGAYVSDCGLRPACNLSGSLTISSTTDSDGCYTISYNTPPVISGSNGALGTFGDTPPTYQYTVTDAQGGTVSVTEKLDSTTLRTYNVSLGNKNTLTIPTATWKSLSNAGHTLTITAKDTQGATATRTQTFTKNATAPVISADDEDIAQSISVIFLFNVIAALLFPALGMALGLSDQGFGLFAGTAVNDTSSVTAAAAAWDGMHPGANTLDAATIVKLTRTLAIIPITLALAFWNTARAKKSGGTGKNTFQFRRIFPFFILFFILASLIATVCTQAGVSSAFFSPFKELSKFLIVMAMAAIGLNTDLVKLIRTGGKPIFMGFCCWAGIACVSLAFQKALGIW